LTFITIRKTKKQKNHIQEFCSQNDKYSEQLLVNSVWYLSCNFNLSAENRNIHSSAWSVSECETNSVSIQTQEIWHEESDQEHMSENMQQAVMKKTSSTAAINANWKKN